MEKKGRVLNYAMSIDIHNQDNIYNSVGTVLYLQSVHRIIRWNGGAKIKTFSEYV